MRSFVRGKMLDPEALTNPDPATNGSYQHIKDLAAEKVMRGRANVMAPCDARQLEFFR